MGFFFLWVLTWEVVGQMGISKQGMVLLKYASLSNVRSETTLCAAFVSCYVEPILPITPTKKIHGFLTFQP
jgi:hypothetical protein